MKKVYIAGPDVFFPDIAARAAEQKAWCARLGIEALHPVDQPTLTAEHIYRHNIALIREADGIVANLDPFRGAEVDSGTAFEVGYAAALGKPVVGYVTAAGDLQARVAAWGPVAKGADGLWRDGVGCLIEDFGLPVNLMLGIGAMVIVGDFTAALQVLQSRF